MPHVYIPRPAGPSPRTSSHGSYHIFMNLEAERIQKAEPPILLEDSSGQGYSHFAIFEDGGLDLISGHLKLFYAKHG